MNFVDKYLIINEQALKTILITMAGATLMILLMTAIILLMRIAARPRWVLINSDLITRNSGNSERITAAGNGIFCGRCGQPLEGDPVKAIALADRNYLVYRCKTCSNETLLTEK